MQAILDVGRGLTDRQRARALVLGCAVGGILFASILVVGFKHTVPVIGLLGASVLVIALVRFPIVAASLVLFLLPFHSAILIAVSTRAGLPVGPLRYWEDAVIVCLFLRSVYERVRTDHRFPLDNRTDNMVLAYIVAYVVLAVASPARATVNEALGVYVEGPLLFLAIRFLRPTRRQMWMCVTAVLAAATIMGGAAILEKFGPHEGLLRWYGLDERQVAYSASAKPYRSASFMIDTLILAFYLAGAAAFACASVAIRSRWRMVAVIGFVATAGGLVCTITRSGYLGGAFGIVIVLLLVVRNPRVRLALIGIAAITIGSLAIHYVSTGTLTRGEGDTAHKRALQRDIDLVMARPIGYGLGTTDRFRFRTKQPGQLGATESTYMARALEGGVEALGLYLVTLFVLIVSLRQERRRALEAGDDSVGALASGAMGTIIAIALAGLFLGVLERPVEQLLWGVPALALAFPIARGRLTETGASADPSTSPMLHA